jgi:hypothetical protein
MAAPIDQLQTVSLLIKAGAKINEASFQLATSRGSSRLISLLVQHKADLSILPVYDNNYHAKHRIIPMVTSEV